MAEQLDLADAPMSTPAPPPAPDPWPAMRAAHPGKALARRILMDRLEQDWIVLEGDLAKFHDGATMFVYATPASGASGQEDVAEIVERFNRLWHEQSAHGQRA